MNTILKTKIKGYAAANLMAMLIVGITKYSTLGNDNLAISYTLGEFIIVPFIMGLISAYIWKDLELTGSQLTGYSCINGFIAIVLSYFFLKEGVICLIIVSPLLFAFILTGSLLGKAMFKKNNQTLNVSVFSLLLVVFVADSLTKHSYENEVSDQLVINAPVSKVWKYVVAYDGNNEPDKYWLFKLGMPSPVQSTVSSYQLGADRKCIFSNGYTFDEKIVTFDVDRNLTFDVTNQPRDPEIMGHIDILRGQFLLKDNGNGTTTVTGNSWYRLYVFPVWYYDRWAQSITRNVHIRVMEHIKHLCERE